VVTGPADNWSGWGSVINAPSHSICDFNPADDWANYGFELNDSDIDQVYCAGTCLHYYVDNNDNQTNILDIVFLVSQILE
jgi:hypothetical protein